MKILIVEDEFALADVVRDRLLEEEFEVEIAEDGEIGEYLALSGIFDLVVMDGMLPEIDGLDVIKRMREEQVYCPVLMLTARSEVSDKIEGLKTGADDYMTKPFEMEELVARIYALLRRNTGYGERGISFGDVRLDMKAGKLCNCITQKSVSIAAKEMQLMEYLLTNRQQTVTRLQISERIWGPEEDVDYNNVEVYISFLRKKLKHIGAKLTIKTVRGIGYCLEE